MEKLYHAVVFIGALCALVIVGFVLYCVRSYTETFGQEFLIVSAVMTLCFCGLLIFSSVMLGYWIQAKVNRAMNHERLVVHGNASFYLDPDGMPLYTGAIQESAKISTFALEQANNRQVLEEALRNHHAVDLSEDSTAIKVQNLVSQGRSERNIAETLGIKRSEVQKLKRG